MKLHNNLRERREELGLSIVEIAKRAGVSRPTIMKYENSEENVITKVIKAYGLKLEPINEPEPLIKDEKIRKAVRAWADVNSLKWAAYSADGKFYDKTTDTEISFKTYTNRTDIPECRLLPIAKLCGEEE